VKVAFAPLLLLVVGLSSYNCCAQSRKIDVEVKITHPSSTHTFISPSNDSLQILISNQGPDTLIPTDRFSIQLEFGGDIPAPDYVPINRILFPGDTFHFTKHFRVNYVGDVDSFPLCIVAFSWSTQALNLIQSERNISFDDNKYCIYPNHKDSTHLGDQNVTRNPINIYPNPADDYLILSCPPSIQIHSITWFSGRGQQLLELTPATKSINLLNVSELARGTYLICIETNRMVFWERVIVR
jgi:hypothetical protein